LDQINREQTFHHNILQPIGNGAETHFTKDNDPTKYS